MQFLLNKTFGEMKRGKNDEVLLIFDNVDLLINSEGQTFTKFVEDM